MNCYTSTPTQSPIDTLTDTLGQTTITITDTSTISPTITPTPSGLPNTADAAPAFVHLLLGIITAIIGFALFLKERQ